MPMPLRRCRRRHSVCRSRGAADSQLSPPKNNHPGRVVVFLRGAANKESTRMHAAAFAAQMNMPMPLRRHGCRHSVCRSHGAADSQLSPPKSPQTLCLRAFLFCVHEFYTSFEGARGELSHTKVPPYSLYSVPSFAICTAAAASARASAFRCSIAASESGAPESAAAASASAPPRSPATRSGLAQPM